MDPLAVIGVLGTLIAIAAGVVQITQYFNERRLRKIALKQSQSRELAPAKQKGLDANEKRQNWGEAPETDIFYGRHEEIKTLEQWIIKDHCRLVAVLGIGAIGKTALVSKVARQIKGAFNYIIWYSLKNAQPLDETLTDCILFLSDQQEINLPENLDKKISLLIQYLRKSTCLIILDNFEAVLQSGDLGGHYREGYERYGDLIRRIGETQHSSCLLLTGREKPREIALQEGQGLVRSLVLKGVGLEEGRAILQYKGVFGTDKLIKELIHHYSGNPLALAVVASTIFTFHNGDIEDFLKSGSPVFGDIRDELNKQFDRLSQLELEVIYWLTVDREAVSLENLIDDIVPQKGYGELLETLESLNRRSLIEKSSMGFILQNVVLEYATGRFINLIDKEIRQGSLSFLISHSLVKAQAKNYIREIQMRLILRPIVESLLKDLGESEAVNVLYELIRLLRKTTPMRAGYAGGNLLNMLVELNANFKGCDFSHLVICQAYLQGVVLQEVNLEGSNLAKSVFTESFGGIFSVAFSRNGKLLAAAGVNGDVRIRQTIDGKHILTCDGHTDWVRSIAFSPDDSTLASSGEDLTIILWNVNNGKYRHKLEGHTNHVRSVAFSPDGSLLVSGSDDQTVRIWDVLSGECLRVFRGHSSRVRSTAFSPAGNLIASGSVDQTIRLWEVSTGECVAILHEHIDCVRTVVFNADGTLMASGSDDLTVRLWDVRSVKCIEVLQGHIGAVRALAFSPSKDLLASSSEDRTIKLWDLETMQCIKTMQGHTNGIRAIDFSPDGNILVSGSLDQSVRLWDVRDQNCIKVLQGFSNGIKPIAFSPQGELLASGSDDQTVRLWDIHSGNILKSLKGHTSLIWSVAFSPDGELLASGSDDRSIRLWDVRTGKHVKTLYGSSCVLSVVFDPTGNMLVTGNYDQTIKLWDVRTGELLKTLDGHTGLVWSVAFSPDGSILASASNDQTVRLWDARTGKLLNTLEHISLVWSVAFSPDGSILASASNDQTIKLWDVRTGELLKTLDGHTGLVWSVAFSPDGSILASASNDQTVRLWDARTGKLLNTLHGHERRVWGISFSPDGSTLASASEDETIKLWQSNMGDLIRTLRISRPYEGLNITGTTGLTQVQKKVLKGLGAFEYIAKA